MPELSLSQAAKLTGKSKSTINRAIKTGKLSAARHEDGSYSIDPAELSRAFDLE
ncbi:helix-turn-helix domain-containing protein, partial [Paracoccus salipaludis]|uniref:helix-turn-helix domain-containing protein n=1 Tax=Paracoccus salipaludis TaxID=2032623 RepID=UPI001072B14C